MKRVLFLCTGNSCRSQMAEGWLRHLAKSRFEVASAGTHPKKVHPLAIETMAEVGIDIAQHRSKSINDLVNTPFDYIITVCDNAKEICPLLPLDSILLHWSFEDPAAAKGTHEERKMVFVKVRDQIRSHLNTFLNS